MIRWELIERITHLIVTALLVIWLYLLTDWVTILDHGQGVLTQTMIDVVKFLEHFQI